MIELNTQNIDLVRVIPYNICIVVEKILRQVAFAGLVLFPIALASNLRRNYRYLYNILTGECYERRIERTWLYCD